MTLRGASWAATTVACLAATWPAASRAEPSVTVEPGARADQCASAAESAQLRRKEGHLRAARTELLACGADACPAVVRADCLSPPRASPLR
ncbi:MAG TPA: hypothetical protein VH137_07680, partial [Gemmatimonadales bacterium]|nr:hypothetical protein [Gemmatimonadales bacterium]